MRKLPFSQRLGRAICITVALLFVATSCRSAEPSELAEPTGEAFEAVVEPSELAEPTGEAFEAVAERATAGTRVRTYDSIEDLTSLIASVPEGDDVDLQVVVGTVTEVRRAQSVRWELTANYEETILLPFDDSDAQLNRVHLTTEVIESIVAPPHESSVRQVTVGLFVPLDLAFEKIEADYLSLGKTVFFLNESRAFEPGIYGILEAGAMMGVVDDSENVVFPLLAAEDTLVTPEGIALDRIREASLVTDRPS